MFLSALELKVNILTIVVSLNAQRKSVNYALRFLILYVLWWLENAR